MNRKIAVAIIIILSVVAMTLTTTKANTVMQSITPTVELGPEIIVAVITRTDLKLGVR